MAQLRRAMRKLLERGWTPIPLGADANGKPKRPLPKNWPNVRREVVPQLMWDRAEGLGIVLGPASNNLAVIDIDDNALARATFALLAREWCTTKQLTRMVWTGRRNLHVYCYEEVPSGSAAFRVDWGDATNISVELKAKGTQVAAPPTPGYRLATPGEPITVPRVAHLWAGISAQLGIRAGTDTTRPDSSLRGGNQPLLVAAWKALVPAGQRNNTAFREACDLRDKPWPLEEALQMMRARWEGVYEAGMTWAEMEATVRSAYRREVRTSPAGPKPGRGRRFK